MKTNKKYWLVKLIPSYYICCILAFALVKYRQGIQKRGASLMAQEINYPPSIQETQETRVRSLGQEAPLEKEAATHSSILA